MRIRRDRRRLFAAEVVQTSTMDCGPAALKSLLASYGIRVSYGRLREACQTDVDGTSIDTLEEVANQLGLVAEQVMVPVDHVLLKEAGTLPCIVVVRLANGVTHFVVIWRRHGDLVQIMDPGVGRRWIGVSQLLADLYQHQMAVPAEAWREWANTDDFIDALRYRLIELGFSGRAARKLQAEALEDPEWRGIAALDAATRMVAALVRAGGLRVGRQASGLARALYTRAKTDDADGRDAIPPAYWQVEPATVREPTDGAQLLLQGAVLVRVMGRRDSRPEALDEAESTESEPLSPELVAALEEPPSRPGRELFRLLRADGLLPPFVVLLALVLGAGGVMVEALIFRGFFEIGRDLALFEQRFVYLGVIVGVLGALALLELPIRFGLQRMGRHLEIRLRLEFLKKIPKLGDRYFQSRLSSDMAERGHALHLMRALPVLAAHFLQSVFGLVFTTAGIIWLDPASAPYAVAAAVGSVLLPLLLQPPLTQRDMRFRTHGGALTRFYLDALLGLVPARTHGAEPAIRRDHEGLLVDWANAGLSAQRAIVVVEGLLALSGFGLAALLLFTHLGREGQGGAVLLLIYWALNLPALGQKLAYAARQYPSLRNVTLRLLEPLGAPESEHLISAEGDPADEEADPSGVSVRLEDVTVVAAGHTILRGIDLDVGAGEHVAIVGSSGAGKSSLVGLLLGWHRAAAGRVVVAGETLEGAHLDWLRRRTAWVDPAVQLWNRSLYANLLYGNRDGPAAALAQVIEEADLRKLLESLPDGLQTALGESGALVSGGEGQRVRLGRSFARRNVRLVILDEPFRGLDRDKRQTLLARAREWWSEATVLYITHDVGQAQDFDRVLVIEGGRIVEDGPPEVLNAEAASRFTALVEAEEAVRTKLWTGSHWRRLWLEGGQLEERPGPEAVASGNGPPEAGPSPDAGDKGPDPGAIELPDNLFRLSWPMSSLNQTMEVLVRETRLPHEPTELPTPPADLERVGGAGLGPWIEGAARRLGLEAEPVETSYAEVEPLVRGAGPALLVIRHGHERRVLALMGRRGNRLRLLGTDLRPRWVSVEGVRAALCAGYDKLHGSDVDRLLEEARVPRRRRRGVRRDILREQLGPARVGGCWLLRLPPETSYWRQLRQEGLVRFLALLAGSHAFQYFLFIVSWWLIGRGALSGNLEIGWLVGWALILLTMVPFKMLATWCQGRFAIGSGALMKRRLLQGALRLEPEEIRHEGSGQLLGRVLESEALESLAVRGGFMVVMAFIELFVAAGILAIGAGGGLHLLLLVAWVGASVFLTLRYVRRTRIWTDSRLTMTNDLVERMVGHRTRLAQQTPDRWHEGEDQAVESYLVASERMDRLQVWLTALVARAWPIVGILGMGVAFVSGQVPLAALAIGIGGVIAAQQALDKLSMSVSDLGGAAIAWSKVAPLFKAAERSDDRPALEAAAEVRPEPQPGAPLIEADDVVFGYPGRAEPILKGCHLHVRQGDRLLLEGPSGCGKSTFASLLVGLRVPQSGLLLLHGLDRRTLGAWRWRQHVTAAPQFHENHVFTETFAFNLLMGRGWPPAPGDMDEAETLCRQLGLGEVLSRMPAGMLQMVGETGWQLSHGERSRLFLARALLERADLIVLDESFAALDPENLELALRCVLEKAPTVLVIAHP